MTDNQLINIRKYLVEHIFRNATALRDENIRYCPSDNREHSIDLIDVIATLYNYLEKEVTGAYYDYMFHWANKEGCYVNEHIFDDIKDGGYDLVDR